MTDNKLPDLGPWTAQVWKSRNEVVLQSDNFEHDVALIVNGDFADHAQKLAYAEGLADWMNAAATNPPLICQKGNIMSQVSREMPRYQCHKKVWALKIAAIAHNENPDSSGHSASASYGAVMTPAEDGYAPFTVDGEYVAKHRPKAGGYYVVYDDGYKSYSPAEAFESGYAPCAVSAMSGRPSRYID